MVAAIEFEWGSVCRLRFSRRGDRGTITMQKANSRSVAIDDGPDMHSVFAGDKI
jgi:hypothetical protein